MMLEETKVYLVEQMQKKTAEGPGIQVAKGGLVNRLLNGDG